MLKFITNMQISRRLLLAFLLAAVIPGAVITTLGITFAKKQVAQGQILQTNISAFKSTTTTGSYLPKMHYLINQVYHDQYTTQNPTQKSNIQRLQMDLQQIGVTSGYFVSGTNQFRQNYAAATGNSMQRSRDLLIEDYSSQHFAEQQLKMLNAIQQRLWPSYSSAQNRALIAISQHAPDATSQTLLAEANAAYIPLQAQWDDLNALTELIGERIAETGGAQSNPWLMVTLVALLASLGIVIGIGYAIYRTITIPLHQLAWLTRRIALGETSARAKIDGNDEIYLVATSMNNMLDSIVRLIQEAQAQRDMLQGQVEKLVSEVSGIGEGDLRVQAEVSTDTLGMLADSFNYMIEELGGLVVRVKSVASEVEKSTRMVVKRMAQLVENGNRQLEGISDATSEIEQMTQANHQIAERTQLLYNVARVARLDAQLGRDSVEQAVSEMNRITENVQGTASRIHNLGERSREINEIVEVISGIAHQTNRLALDAAIQAAMAGENGKGFGAVAADIRRLAERAKDQTLLIARIVRTIREDISSAAFSMQDTQRVTVAGSRLTQEAGVALESLFAAVEHQAREIECINQLATQQVQSSHRIVQIMQNTSETTRQNSNNTQHASQRIEQLARLVEQLRASVEAFKLRENQPYQVSRPTIASESANSAENPLTISGVFRSVHASIRPRRIASEPVQYAIDNYGTGQRIPLKPLYSIPFTPPRMPLPIPDFTYPSLPNFPPAPPVPPFQTVPPAPALPAAPPAPPETANDYATYTAATAVTPADSRTEQARTEPADAEDWTTTKRAIMHKPNQ